MKILTPSSAPLTLAEVSHHLSTHPVRRPDPRVGAYPIVDLSRYRTVRREVERYVEGCVPWNGANGMPEGMMEKLVQALKPWGLSQAEVVMVCDLGIGRDRRRNGGAGMELDEEEMREIDERVLGCVFEEGRYEEGELKQIVEAVEEALRGVEVGNDTVMAEGKPVQSVEAEVKVEGDGRRVTRSAKKQAQEQRNPEEEDWQDPMEAVLANLVSRASKERMEPSTGQDEGKAVINKYKLRKGRQSYDGAEDEGDDDDDDDDVENMLVDEQAAVSRAQSED